MMPTGEYLQRESAHKGVLEDMSRSICGKIRKHTWERVSNKIVTTIAKACLTSWPCNAAESHSRSWAAGTNSNSWAVEVRDCVSTHRWKRRCNDSVDGVVLLA